MRNYEIIILLNITNKLQCENIIEKYLFTIKEKNGIIHRLEYWGIRELAYKINNINKAYYVLLNIECNISLLNELKNDFKLNNFIIRNIIINKKNPIKQPSIIIKEIIDIKK